MCSITQVLPEDFEMTSVKIFGSTPNPSAIRKASLTATAATPATRLLQSFATSPAPTSPTWMMLAPIAASTGRASSKSRGSPPTMIASVPSVARGTPPDTGASMKRAPRLAAASATRRDTPGSIVDMSMQRRPAPTPSSTPPGPRYAASTCDDEGRIVMTSSPSRAAAADDAARAAPALTAPASADSTTSYATIWWPCLTRFASIGWPIAPIPMNPIFMGETPLSPLPRRADVERPRTLPRPSYDRGVHRARQAPRTVSGLVLIALAAVSWGTSGSVMTVLAERNAASPLLVGVARLWLAAILLLLAAARAARPFALAQGDRWRCLAMGACMAAYQAAYFTAVTLAGIAVVALVAICSAPLIIAALAPLTLGEVPGTRVRGALALGVPGTALLIAVPGGGGDLSARFFAGGALALGAGLAYALYVLLTKAALARTAPLPLTALTFGAGALLLAPMLLWTDAPLAQLARGWPWLLYLGAVATAGAYALYAGGLRFVPASVAGIVYPADSLTATLIGVLIFGERLGPGGVVGGVLLLAALG